MDNRPHDDTRAVVGFFSVSAVSQLTITARFLAYGDSKSTNSYPADLRTALAPDIWQHNVQALAGRTTAAAASTIDANLVNVPETIDYVLHNLGANDVSALPAEATWKANTAAILDAYHAKWPNATVLVARVWVRDFATECDTLWTWAQAVMASRAWCAAGIDETVVLEGGDNGVTNTSDGTHPSAAGIAATVAAWKVILTA